MVPRTLNLWGKSSVYYRRVGSSCGRDSTAMLGHLVRDLESAGVAMAIWTRPLSLATSLRSAPSGRGASCSGRPVGGAPRFVTAALFFPLCGGRETPSRDHDPHLHCAFSEVEYTFWTSGFGLAPHGANSKGR
jgi:hypothetical protein